MRWRKTVEIKTWIEVTSIQGNVVHLVGKYEAVYGPYRMLVKGKRRPIYDIKGPRLRTLRDAMACDAKVKIFRRISEWWASIPNEFSMTFKVIDGVTSKKALDDAIRKYQESRKT